MHTKKCIGCGQSSPAVVFGKNAAKRDGLMSRCKGCERQREEDRRRNMVFVPVAEQRCRKCLELLGCAAFRRSSSRTEGISSVCRKCEQAAEKEAHLGRTPTSPVQKFCTRCAQTLPADAFHKNRRTGTGLSVYCKGCNRLRQKEYTRQVPDQSLSRDRAQRIKNLYGLDVDSFEQMLWRQQQACAICKAPFGDSTPYVDHCHNSKRVRGLLCRQCNLGLGHFSDDVQVLHNAIHYLDSGM